MPPTRSSLPVILDAAEPGVADALFSAPFGLFGKQKIRAMIGRKLIRAETEIEPAQLQPASLDLRISKEAYRVRASFLPGRGCSVRERLKSLNAEPVSLAGKGAVLEKGIVYVARLIERLELQAQPFRRRKPEELDRPARHFHPPHRRRRRGVRRRAARL